MQQEDEEPTVLGQSAIGQFLYRFDDIWANYAAYFASPHYYRIPGKNYDSVLIGYVQQQLGLMDFIGLWGIGDLGSAALYQRGQLSPGHLNARVDATLAKLKRGSIDQSIELCQRIRIELLALDAILLDPAAGTAQHAKSGMNNCVVVVKRCPSLVTIVPAAQLHMADPVVPNNAMEFWFDGAWHPRSSASFGYARNRAIVVGTAQGFLLPPQFPME